MSDRTLPVHAASPPAPGPDPRRWWALVLLCLAQFMVILDITVVNVALPTIGSDLQLDRASLTWVVTAYTLCFGGLLLLGGRLADTLGRRRTFLTGLGVFTAASLASGLAQGGTALVAARAGQGVGAALLSPAALAIITTTFHGAERNRALGIWAAIAGAGAAVGVLAGGLLVEYASWRWVFYINLPVGILVAAAVPALIAAVRPGHRAARLDLLGALAGTLATAAVIYGLVAAGSQSWGATTTLLPLATGLVLAGGFVAVERTAREPLVPLELLARRPLLAGQLVMLASSSLLLATYFLCSLYLQRLHGYTALGTGLVFLPAALATIAGSHLAAQAVSRLRPRPIAAVGFSLAAVGTLLLSRLPADAVVLVELLPGLLLATAGLGAGFVVATTTAMAHVDQAQAGVTSGLLSTGTNSAPRWGWRWSPRSPPPASPATPWPAAHQSAGSTGHSWPARCWPPWPPRPPDGCCRPAAHPLPTGRSSPTDQRPTRDRSSRRRHPPTRRPWPACASAPLSRPPCMRREEQP